MPDFLKRVFGIVGTSAPQIPAKAVSAFDLAWDLKHYLYLQADAILAEAQERSKSMSASEIDAFFNEKRAQLKSYAGE